MPRILITGSRDWTNERDMATALRDAYLRFKPQAVTLVSGHASKGADPMAEMLWSKHVPKGLVEPHPADWNKHGKAAGFIRNAEMVDAGADLCLAFVMPCSKPNCLTENNFHYSHGAMDTYNKAKDAGIESIMVYDTDTPPF